MAKEPNEQFRIHSLSLLSSQATQVLSDWEQRLVAGNRVDVLDADLCDALCFREDLKRMISVYRLELDSTNPAMFAFLSSAQQQLLRRQLVRAHYLYSIQHRIDAAQGRWDALRVDKAQCKRYEYLLSELRLCGTRESPPPPPDLVLQRLSDASDKPVAWIGVVGLAPLMAAWMMDLCAGTLSLTKAVLLYADRRSSFFGWSRTLGLCVLNALTIRWNQMSSHTTDIGQFSQGLSYLNACITYTLFSLELFLLMKNTLAVTRLIQQRALNLSTFDYFTLQLQQRKFILLELLGGAIVGTIGFLCFVGELNPWPWTLPLSVGFKLCQLTLVAFQHQAESVQHERTLQQLQQEINELLDKQIQLRTACDAASPSIRTQLMNELCQVQQETDRACKLHVRAAVTWQFKSIAFRNQFMSLLGLLVGFGLFACFVFPPAGLVPATALMIGLVGASVCVAMILLITTWKVRLAHAETSSVHTLNQELLAAYLLRFKQLNAMADDSNVHEMQCIYLEMKYLVSDSQRTQQILAHQLRAAYIKNFLDALMPISFVVSCLLLPTGMALGMVVFTCVVNSLLQYYLNQPASPVLTSHAFNPSEFDEFSADPTLEKLTLQVSNSSYKVVFNGLTGRNPSMQPLSPDDFNDPALER